jgi:hypothetical protein
MLVDDRQTFGAHPDSIERAGLSARSQAQAADGAHFHAAAKQSHRPAIIKAVVDIFRICFLNPKITAWQGNIRFNSFDLNTHNSGNGFGHFFTGGHTRIGCRCTGDDGLGIGAATRQPATASVGAGQFFFDRQNLGINIYVKNLGCDG